jgi:hypothetical protein
MHWDRRAFLRNTSTLVFLSPFLHLACRGKEEKEKLPPGIEFLSPVQYKTLVRLIEVVLPQDSELPDPLKLHLPQEMDAFLRSESEAISTRIRDALLFVEWSPRVSRYFKNFSDLPLPERRQFFAGFAQSSLKLKRGIYLGLKGLILFFYTDHPETWTSMGYDGPWVREVVP